MRVLSIVTVALFAVMLMTASGAPVPSKETKKATPSAGAVPEDEFTANFTAELQKVRAAIADADKRLKKTPKDANLYFVRSQMYSALGEHNKASLDRKKAVELNPGLAAEAAQLLTVTPMICDTEIALGTEFLRRGRFDYAEIKFRSAQEADPKKPGGFLGMGQLFNAQKQYAKALECFKKAIEVKPEIEAGYYQRAITYMKMGQPAKALPDLAKVIEIGNRAEAYYVRSLAYKALKKKDKAEEDLKKATELDADVATKVPAL